MHFHLLDPQSLKSGTPRQKEVAKILTNLQIFEILKDASPVLTGALPLGIEQLANEINIACAQNDLESFANAMRTHFEKYSRFEVHHKLRSGVPCVVARFGVESFIVEVFAQNQSVFQQQPVLLTLIEARLLAFSHPMAKTKIQELMLSGLGIEEAFAETYVLEGEPREELLKLTRELDRDILEVAHGFVWNADLSDLTEEKTKKN